MKSSIIVVSIAVVVLLSGTCASAFTVSSSTISRASPDRRREVSHLYSSSSDGNPPPFGSWGQQQPQQPPAPAPASTSPYSDWGQPTATAAAAAPQTASWSPPPAPAPAPATTTAPPAPSSASSSSTDAIATLAASQDATLQKIQAAIPDLTYKPDHSWSIQDGISIAGGAPARLEAYDAPGASNVAWLASLCVENKISSLTIYNGPLTDVPHIESRCCLMLENDNTELLIQLVMDVRPRAYGAYETKDDRGNYPGPEQLGRKAFEYSGARNEFFTKFGNNQVKALLSSDVVSQFEEGGGHVTTTPLPHSSEYDLLTEGPLALRVAVANTPANVERIVRMRQQLVDVWLEWTTAQHDRHAHRPGAAVNGQYVYDAKFRQNAYLGLLAYYSELYDSEDSKKLAAAESGPLDEAYVGGGS